MSGKNLPHRAKNGALLYPPFLLYFFLSIEVNRNTSGLVKRRLSEVKLMRQAKFDNLRALLIVLVVYCHLSGAFQLGGPSYQIIYTFHMPAFIFVSGYFASQKNAWRTLAIYAVTQVLDFIFYRFVYGSEELAFRLTEPYMFGWYLMSLFWYQLLIPLIDLKRPWQRGLFLLGAFVAAVAVGFDTNAGYWLSVSRTVVYLPFFAAGLYLRRAKDGGLVLPRWAKITVALVSAAVCAYGVYYALGHRLNYAFLYGAQAYATFRMNIVEAAFTRAQYLVFAAAWTALLLVITPDRQLPIITRTGRNTLPVFILHGYIAALMFKHGLWVFGEAGNYAAAVVLAVIICAVLGNVYLTRLFSFRSLFRRASDS